MDATFPPLPSPALPSPVLPSCCDLGLNDARAGADYTAQAP
jgi:hypothetical protein